MSAVVLPLPRPQPTAFIERIGSEYRISLRNCPAVHANRQRTYPDEGEVAEYAVSLRDLGGWRLSYGPSADGVRELVDEMTGGGAA